MKKLVQSLLTAFTIVTFPAAIVHAQEAPKCETVADARAQAKEHGVETIVLEGDALTNFKTDFTAKHGKAPVIDIVDALVFVKVVVENKLELGLVVFVEGCAVQAVPPGFIDAQDILLILEGPPA
jgi:Asp/Glu/hydantoin racemase